MNLGKEVANLRLANNMTQEELAEKIGVSRQAVTKWEASESIPELTKIIAMADLFCVSVEKLIGRGDTIYDMVKTRVEELSDRCRKAYDGDDMTPFIRRYMEYSESIGLSAEQIMNGLLYLCDSDEKK